MSESRRKQVEVVYVSEHFHDLPEKLLFLHWSEALLPLQLHLVLPACDNLLQHPLEILVEATLPDLVIVGTPILIPLPVLYIEPLVALIDMLLGEL